MDTPGGRPGPTTLRHARTRGLPPGGSGDTSAKSFRPEPPGASAGGEQALGAEVGRKVD